MKEFKSIKDTSIYNIAEDIEEKYKKILTKGNGTIKLNAEKLHFTIEEIKRRSFKNDAKFNVIKAIETGRIQVIYNEKYLPPLGVPFIKTKNGIAIVNITKMSEIDESGMVINLDAKLFYSICFTALAFADNKLELLFKNESLVGLYANMMSQVFNQINKVDKNKMDALKYLSAKFYILSQLSLDERKEEEMKTVSLLKNYDFMNSINTVYLNEIDDQFSLEWYNNLESFLSGIKVVFAKEYGSRLEMKNFVSSWYAKYAQISGFAVEYPPFLFMVIALVYFKGVGRMDLFRSNNIEPMMNSRATNRLMGQLTSIIKSI